MWTMSPNTQSHACGKLSQHTWSHCSFIFSAFRPQLALIKTWHIYFEHTLFKFSALDPCGSQPCLNGGVCTNQGTDYVCTCATGYTVTHCEIGKYSKYVAQALKFSKIICIFQTTLSIIFDAI